MVALLTASFLFIVEALVEVRRLAGRCAVHLEVLDLVVECLLRLDFVDERRQVDRLTRAAEDRVVGHEFAVPVTVPLQSLHVDLVGVVLQQVGANGGCVRDVGRREPGAYFLDPTTLPPDEGARFDSVRIMFTVPSGWEAWDLGVLKGKPGAPDVNNLLGVGFWNVSTVPADPCHWQRGGPRVGPTVDDLATALANQSRRAATTPTDVTLAGYAGKHLTLTVPAHIDFAGHEVFPACDQGSFFSWNPPPESAFARYHQGPGHFDELWILDVDGFRLVINAGYWRNTPARDLAEIHQIVESVRIERG